MNFDPVFEILKGARRIAGLLPIGAADRICSLLGRVWWQSGLPPVSRIRRDLSAAAGHFGERALHWPGIEKLGARVFGNHFRILLETLLLNGMADHELLSTVEVLGQEKLPKSGYIILIPHYGNWEVLGCFLARYGLPIHSFYMDQRISGIEAFLNESRKYFGIRLIDREDVRLAVKILKNGGAMGVIADQDGGAGGFMTRLMGRPASFPRGAEVLSRLAGVPIVPMAMRRVGPLKFQVSILEPLYHPRSRGLKGEQAEAALYNEMVMAFERTISADPSQWLWFYDRFKPRRHLEGLREPFPSFHLAAYSALLNGLLLLAGMPLVLWKLRTGELPSRLREYIGKPALRPPAPGMKRVVFHCVSVGEAGVAIPLAKALGKQMPGLEYIFTTTCRDGFDLIQSRFREEEVSSPVSGGFAGCFYQPLDLSSWMGSFLDRVRPDAIVISETDFWPGHIMESRRRGIGLFLFNGRISKGIARVYGHLRPLSRAMMKGFVRMWVQTSTDRSRLIHMAADPRIIALSGNAKFDVPVAGEGREELGSLLKSLKQYTVLVFGSTHPEDEEFILQGLAPLNRDFPDESILVIAPRKIERISEVAERFTSAGRGVHFLSQVLTLEDDNLFSALQPGQVLLVDTMGDLFHLYSCASAAYVGGGFRNTGIHSPIEPLIHGVPVVTGPNVKNFRDLVQEIGERDFVRVVNEGTQIFHALEIQSDRAGTLKEGILQHVESHRGITGKIAGEICAWLREGRQPCE